MPKSRSIYDILADRKMSASSTKYLTYAPKRVVSAPVMDVPISYQSEPSAVRYTTTYRQYEAPAPKPAPTPAPSSYEPVRSYELKNTEPGYGDASSVSLLSGGGYTSGPSGQGSLSISYAPAPQAQSAPQTSAYRQLAGQIAPRLKAVEYDDSQKSALADFASALENFELKSITNQDIYDIPVINPPLTRIAVKPKAVAAAQADSDGGYGGPKPTYAAPPPAAASSYDDTPRSYAPAPSAASSYAPPASASADYSERPSESYRPSSSYGASSSSYDRAPSESYRASGTDSYGSSAVYVPPPSSYESSVPSESSYKPSSSYSSASTSDYYSQGSAPVPNQDDPNCPYRNQGAASADYSTSSSSSSTSYINSSNSPKSKNVESSSSYEADELDPSKLELKIVHLPVSVLKRLVGSGDLALPSFNKKK